MRRHYGSDLTARISGEYRFGDTRHIQSDIDALKQLGWVPRRTPAESVAEYAAWREVPGGRYPFSVVLSFPETKLRAELVLDKVELDVPIDAALFRVAREGAP